MFTPQDKHSTRSHPRHALRISISKCPPLDRVIYDVVTNDKAAVAANDISRCVVRHNVAIRVLAHRAGLGHDTTTRRHRTAHERLPWSTRCTIASSMARSRSRPRDTTSAHGARREITKRGEGEQRHIRHVNFHRVPQAELLSNRGSTLPRSLGCPCAAASCNKRRNPCPPIMASPRCVGADCVRNTPLSFEWYSVSGCGGVACVCRIQQ